MLARTTESVLVKLEDSSCGGAHAQHKHPLQDAETSEYQQDGIPAENWTGHERVGEGQIRCDDLRRGDQCPRVSERTATHRTATMDRHTEKSLCFLEVHAVKNSVRYHQALQEFLPHTFVAENPLVADAEIDEALVAFFNEKYRLGYSSSTGDILLGKMRHYFLDVGDHGGHFLPRSHAL